MQTVVPNPGNSVSCLHEGMSRDAPEVRELSESEIDIVGGGFAPLVGLALRCAASTACRVAVLAAAGAAAAYVGYENNRV